MIDLFRNSLIGQFDASLSMFNDCVIQCPVEQWEHNVGNYPFWNVAYHTLFYVDFYLSPNEASFSPQNFHRENAEQFVPSHEKLVPDDPYDVETIREYVGHCKRKVIRSVAAETAESLAGPSGFSWYKISRAEFVLNNIRHLQHHAAQMSLHLRNSAGINIRWIGSGFKED
ncbi:MAG: DinB family protein [Planctomycetaceae bacterium]|nr:DinB family protein [Planctomycetaceae bacterium]